MLCPEPWNPTEPLSLSFWLLNVTYLLRISIITSRKPSLFPLLLPLLLDNLLSIVCQVRHEGHSTEQGKEREILILTLLWTVCDSSNSLYLRLCNIVHSFIHWSLLILWRLCSGRGNSTWQEVLWRTIKQRKRNKECWRVGYFYLS